MPRPYSEPPEPLSEIINIRCTASTKKQLVEIATASGLSLREVIRRKIDNLRIPHKERVILIYEFREMRNEIKRQGGLIKHLYNQNPINEEESKSALIKLEAAFDGLSRLIAAAESEIKDDSESSG